MSQLINKVSEITLHELIAQGEQILKAYHKQDAAIDAKLLMCYLLDCERIALVLNREQIISRQLEESYLYMIAKRAQGIPLQYITKSQEFMGLRFYVDERVLIPRQDTETLVETIIQLSENKVLDSIIEIGSGSGCISVALAHYLPSVKVTAIDISQEALDVTAKNAAYHAVDNRVRCLRSDLFNHCKELLEPVDLIVSNPPYISKQECKGLMQEVADYEPRIALTDELDGLTFYRNISKEAKNFLKPNGILAYEIGCGQGKAVTDIVIKEGFKEVEVIKDLAGKDRVITAHYRL